MTDRKAKASANEEAHPCGMTTKRARARAKARATSTNSSLVDIFTFPLMTMELS
jgi:hypothetical protein